MSSTHIRQLDIVTLDEARILHEASSRACALVARTPVA